MMRFHYVRYCNLTSVRDYCRNKDGDAQYIRKVSRFRGKKGRFVRSYGHIQTDKKYMFPGVDIFGIRDPKGNRKYHVMR